MKSLFRIYRRYIFSAIWIAGVVICVNLIVFLSVQAVIHSWNEESGSSVLRSQLNRVAAALAPDGEGQMSLGADGEAALVEAEAQFAFLLSDDGTRIWGWKLPEGIQEHYTVGEVASFSRWYLLDYPVRVWNCEQGLLVVANSRESVAKYSVEYSRSTVQNVPFFILAVLGANLLLILFLAVLSGYRLYEGLRPIAYGLDRLVDGRRVAVPENGIARDLARKLNQVSRILEVQRQNLNQRDTARTEWISGVSHDIRTPLSMVMGYADSLENDAALPEEARKEAGIIREQSLKIKTLIEDLNLTSKLEYHMQP
ncbi:MAG TPA: sensor histidine kinase, partial [Candidatus Eisenbergiella intestinigallinarum]|nr:sensor histidine kinase [Candidatus Eisenbergiella intestinigallinarum]